MLFNGGDFTKEEFIDFLLIQNNIDKHIADLYLYPRWKRYKYALLRFASKEYPRTAQSELESGVLVQLIVGEAVVRSAIKRIHRQAIDNSEAAKDLKFHYEEVKALLEKCQNDSFGFHPSVRSICLKELPAYEQLLEDLAINIRKANNGTLLQIDEVVHMQASDGVKEEKPVSSYVVVDKIHNEFTSPQTQKEVRLQFSDLAKEELMKVLLPHIELCDQEVFCELISKGESTSGVKFKGSMVQLTAIFKELKSKKIYAYDIAKDVGRWLSAHFFYYDQFDKQYVKIKEVTATRYLQTSQTEHRDLNKKRQ